MIEPHSILYCFSTKTSLVMVDKRGFFYGGGCRIRTRVEFPPNGFQDRPVMTASVTLRIPSWAKGV